VVFLLTCSIKCYKNIRPMRKVISLVLMLCAGYIGAQSNKAEKVKEILNTRFPLMNLENKLVFVASETDDKHYSINDLTELNKTASVYEFAKLKGGSKGILCVLLIKDTAREIELNKNGFSNIIKIKVDESKDLTLDKPLFINADGSEREHTSFEVKIFKTVNALITR
jgi:hypothetical protein